MDRAAIKSQARQLLKGNTFDLVVVMFVVGLVTGGLNLVVSIRDLINTTRELMLYDYGYSGFNVVFSFSWIITLIMIPVATALSGYFVRFVRTRQASAGEGISYSFKNGFQHFSRYFSAVFVTGLIICLWCLIPLAGWVIAIVYSYRYYFVAQIMNDNPELTGSQAREISKKMTDGMKGELFVMNLSFIGWFILSMFTFGILYLFYVRPYYETTIALYYENLRIRAIQAGVVHPQQFSPYPAGQNDRYGNPIPPVNGAYQQPPYGQQNAYGAPGAVPQQQPIGTQGYNPSPNPNPVPQQTPPVQQDAPAPQPGEAPSAEQPPQDNNQSGPESL